MSYFDGHTLIRITALLKTSVYLWIKFRRGIRGRGHPLTSPVPLTATTVVFLMGLITKYLYKYSIRDLVHQNFLSQLTFRKKALFQINYFDLEKFFKGKNRISLEKKMKLKMIYKSIYTPCL